MKIPRIKIPRKLKKKCKTQTVKYYYLTLREKIKSKDIRVVYYIYRTNKYWVDISNA